MAERAHPEDPGFQEGSLYRANLFKRYAFADKFAKGKTVLDIPCGVGWGTSLLGGKYRVGIDICADAIAYAKEHYPGIDFLAGDMANIPLKNNSIDVVVCLEGFEHVSRTTGMQFLEEAVRVIKDDGLLVMTVPVILPGGRHSGNHYHLHEPALSDLKDILARKFYTQSLEIVKGPDGPVVYFVGSPKDKTDMPEFSHEQISDKYPRKSKSNILLTMSAAPAQSPFCTKEKRPPIGVGFLISVLRQAGHEVFFIDNFLQPSDFLETDYLQQKRIDCVGIYSDTVCFRDTLRMLHKLEHLRHTHQWTGKIIVGGPHTSVAVHTIPDFVDYVVQGEGERAILDIVSNKVSERIVKYPRVQNLDELPMPAWDYFVNLPYNWGSDFFSDRPVFTMNTSRGCPFRCRFCSVGSVWHRKYTFFSAERVISDIEYVIEHYGAKGIYFREDNFTVNRKRLKRFCELIIQKGIKISWACESRVSTLTEDIVELMSGAGAKGLYIGVESGSQRILDFLQKDTTVEQIRRVFSWCHKFGIKTAASVVIGVPGETEVDFWETQKLLKEINPTITWFNVFVGIPDSQLRRMVIDNRLYQYIDDRGLVYLQGHNNNVDRYYGGSWNAYIPDTEERKDWTGKPKVSVLIPVYNCERFISQALESVYNQTYQNFEVIIVDDGSTDRTSEILVDMKDSRTFIYRNPQNKGLTRSLNIGLKLCRGEYVARMDADDVSYPQRFEKQVRFLNENPDCLVVGSWCNWIDSNGEMHGSWEPPTEYEDIKKKLLVNNSLAHGSVMLRRSSLTKIGGYNEKYTYAQDYDLWLRLSEVGEIQNIAEHLYNLRFWTEAVSSARKKQQDEYAELALQEALQRKNIQKLRTSPGASSSPQISVVLTTYNRPELLEKTFTGFANQTAAREDFEVIVVDDGSEPPVKEIVEKFSDRINTVYLYQENGGLAAARNNGIRAVKGRIVLFSDDDDIPGPELIAEHLRSHQENPDERIAVLGHLDWHKDLEVTPLMHYVTHVGGEYFGYDKMQDGQFYDVWKWWGGLVSAKRSLLTSLKGPFDSKLHWGYEDIELACRLLPKDVKIFYNGKAESFVLVPVDFEGFCRRRYRQGRALYRMACAHPELIIPRYHLQNAIEEYRSRYKPFLDEWTSKVIKFEPLLNNQIQSGRPDIARYLKSLYTIYHECFLGYWLKGYVEEMEAVEAARPLKEPIHAQQSLCSLSFPDTTADSEPQVADEVSGRTENDWNQPVVTIATRPLRMTFVNICTPGFDVGSSNLRIYHILKILAAAGHKIDHLYFQLYANDKKYKAAFDCTVNFIKVQQTINSFSDYLYLNEVDMLDCVWITNIWSVDYLNFALQLTKWLKQNRPKTKVVIDTMDFHYKKFKRKFNVLHDYQDLQKAKKFLELEKQLYPIADAVLTVTEVEKSDILGNIGSNCNVSVIPNIHMVLAQSPPLHERKNICFIGSFHIRHNVDAVLWFLREVFPLIIEKKPNVQFHILGFNNEAYKEKFESNRNVKVIGYVKEAEQAIGEYRLFVCPMTYGAGMKGKLGVAAAAATPFVTTTIGAEGFDLVDGQHCFIADNPGDFAHKCLRLLDEDSLWSRFSTKAKDMIAEKFSIRSVSQQIYSLLQPIDTMASQAKGTTGSVSVSVSSEHTIPLQRDTKPKVSIITSCYNSENFLRECLESIKSQTFQQWELILLDDGSTDGTRSIMEEYSRLDGRVRTYYFDCNEGPYVRRNYAITQACSDFIVIHDADDIMSPSKLETFYKEIVADERLMVVGSYYRRFIDEFKGLQYTDCHWLPIDHDEILTEFLSWKHGMSHSSAIIRKAVFDEIGFYDENLFASDTFWFAKVGEYAKHDPNVRFKNIPEYLTLKRVHAKGQTQVLSCFDSRNRRARFRQYWQGKLKKIRQRLRDFPDTDIKTELRNCICSDFLERFRDHFARWESEPLGEDVVWDLLRNAVWLFNKTHYVTCIDVLNGIEAMVPDIARRFKNYYLLRAIAFFALDLKKQSLRYLNMEIQNQNSSGAREFISDYFEKKLTKDVQNWCAERANLCELLMVNAEGSLAECSSERPEAAKKLCNYV